MTRPALDTHEAHAPGRTDFQSVTAADCKSAVGRIANPSHLADCKSALRSAACIAAVCLAGVLAVACRCGAGVLPPAPRELESCVRLARDAAAAGRYSEAVPLLEKVLGAKEDGFVAAGAPGLAQRTLKAEVAALVAALPPEGLAVYETWYGGQSRQALEEAVRDRDRDALARLTRQYPYTAAGAEALLILGHDGLDRGRPLEALAWLRGLERAPAVARRFEPELTLFTAAAGLMSGRPEEAGRALARLGSLGPGVRFRIGDEEFAAGEDPQHVMDVLAQAMGPGAMAPPQAVAGWPMFRGDAARRASADWSGSVGPLLWKVDALSQKPSGSAAATMANRGRSSRGTRLPASHPLVVGSLALVRTPERLIAIDLGSGRQAWEFPWGGETEGGGPQDARSRSVMASSAAAKLAQRMVDDAPYGQIASDGRLVFLLDGLSGAWSHSMPVVMMVRGQRVITRSQPKSHNRLVALDLRKQGKLAWSVGAESGEDELGLAGVFFLGPPLVHEGRLYVLAETQGEIILCVLQARTGRLAWSLALAFPERPVAGDPQRRLAGATPSLARGVLVCPTSAAAVVAVDPVTRSILWGHEYRAVQQDSARALRLRMAGVRVRGAGKNTSADATATIAGGHVLLAPVESDELLCLDLFSGALIWKRPLDDLLYVGGVVGQTVLAVGGESLSVWHLRSGKPAWQELAVPLPDGAKTAGRGFLAGAYYYLPTTAPDILQIDVATGRIVKRLPMKSTPGNLIALGPLLVSQSVEAIEAFGAAPRAGEQ